MRIRKHASKLLGIVAPATSYSPPPTHHAQIWAAPPSCSAVASAGAWQVCQLNLSPWDVVPYANSAHSPFLHCEPQAIESWAEEKGSVIEYEVKNEEEGSNAPTTAIEERTIDDDSRRKSLRNKKKKNDTTTSSGFTAIGTPTLCKKSDGKKWHCKRVAMNHHSFCDYHLNQLRSYNNSNQTSFDKVKSVSKTKTDIIKDVIKPNNVGDSKYYYYAGFGPWSRRRAAAMQDAKEDSMDNKEEVLEGSRTGEEHSHGAEEHNLFEEEDDSEEEMKKQSQSKGRRKRVKARSLKSLL